jgi:hypothetical protein
MTNSNKLFYKAKKIAEKPIFIKRNIKSDKNFSFSYIKYRVLRPLLKGYFKAFQLLQPVTPWTSPASIEFFKKCLTNEMIGLEYGSGRSTIFFAKKLKHLVSVEHNREWFKFVKENLSKEKLYNVDYQFVAQNNPANVKELPEDYKALIDGEKEIKYPKNFFNYSQYVLKFPDNYFDFILIDGRSRVHCALNSYHKLKPGGIFVLDNSERAQYKPIHKLLVNWKKVNTTTGLTDTTIWFKPEHE